MPKNIFYCANQFDQKVIIIMTSLTPRTSFGTAAKMKNLETNAKNYQSTIGKRSVYLEPSSQKGYQPLHNIDPQKGNTGLSDASSPGGEKKSEKIRIEINGSEQCEDGTVNGRREEHGKSMGRESEEKVLKEIGSRVKGFIMRNQELHVHSHQDEILTLKRENEELQAMINRYRIAVPTAQSDSKEEIADEGEEKSRQIVEKRTSMRKVQPKRLFAQEEMGVANLKKYVMTYINTVIDENDDKFKAQQRKIDFLERRVAQLSKIEEKVEHWKFEKTVKLQESVRKSKNFSIAPIKNIGDRLQYQPDDPPEGQQKPSPKMFKNPYKNYVIDQGTQNAFLLDKIRTLQSQLQKLREKYDFEMESHINDISDREELLASIARLSTQNKYYQQQNFQLGERIKLAHEKQGELQLYFLNQKYRTSGKIQANVGHSVKKALIEIRNQLKAFGVNKYKEVEKEMTSIMIERDYLKKQLSQLQRVIAEGSRFSITYREMFLLKEKNSQLEQVCRLYQQKIAEYKKLAMIEQDGSEEIDERALKKQSKEPSQPSQSLKWPSMVHFCMLSSIARLQDLQRQIVNPQSHV